MNFREALGRQILFFDGGMGTLLQERGLKTGEVPETWNVLHPEIVRQIHKEYLLAGSKIGPTKLQKATKLGIKIISEEEFVAMIGGEEPSQAATQGTLF